MARPIKYRSRESRPRAARVPFGRQIAFAGLPEPVTEYRFMPPRRFRFDWAWPDLLVAAEREGGTYTGGRHVRAAGYASDCVKYSEAAILGWRIVRFTVDHERSGLALDMLSRAIDAARKERA